MSGNTEKPQGKLCFLCKVTKYIFHSQSKTFDINGLQMFDIQKNAMNLKSYGGKVRSQGK